MVPANRSCEFGCLTYSQGVAFGPLNRVGASRGGGAGADVVTMDVLRKGIIEIRPVPPQKFLNLVRRFSYSRETGSRLSSQFEPEILAGSERVGTLGLYCCDNLNAVLSYAHTELVHRPGAFEARLDVVLALPHCRGLGLGSLMMSAFFQNAIDALGDRLAHCSTIALHPSVVRHVTRLGFQNLGEGQAPLYSMSVDDQNRSGFDSAVRLDYRRRLRALRQDCGQCMLRSYAKPWCVEEAAEGVPR